MPQSLSKVLLHIVFSTKNRYPFIDEDIGNELFAVVGGICKKLNCPTVLVGDHIHILCSLHRTISQANLVKEIKVKSSMWMKTKEAKYNDFAWQNGYGVFSVSNGHKDRVSKYIELQEELHQKSTFQEEYRSFLDSQGVAYAEKFVWD